MDEILLMLDNSVTVEGGRIRQQTNDDVRKLINDQLNLTGSGGIQNLGKRVIETDNNSLCRVGYH